ncbi:hypothetical protein H671_1g1894 [Cricetulus griseus]|nr:hypothetical protein H671_1g1894 [Cricetulus griseus]
MNCMRGLSPHQVSSCTCVTATWRKKRIQRLPQSQKSSRPGAPACHPLCPTERDQDNMHLLLLCFPPCALPKNSEECISASL